MSEFDLSFVGGQQKGRMARGPRGKGGAFAGSMCSMGPSPMLLAVESKMDLENIWPMAVNGGIP